MLEVLIHGFFGGGTSGFWGGQVVLVIHLSVGQVDFLTKFEPCACMYVCIHYTRFLTDVCVCVCIHVTGTGIQTEEDLIIEALLCLRSKST